MEEQTFEGKAKRLVWNYLAEKGHSLTFIHNIKIVWFCKTLQNWKAMIADLSPGGMFFEVTYNGDKQEAYIDVYIKSENVVVKD